MQIHIDTATDDLPAVIHMLQAYGGHQATTALVADVRKLSDLTVKAAEAIRQGVVVQVAGVPADKLYSGDAIKHAVDSAALANFVASVNEPDHTECDDQGCPVHYADPTPEQVFAAPKSLFDSYVSGDNITVREAREAAQPRSDVTVDAAGLPWDARIHSGAKSKLANGNWKLLRSIDPALVASVEAELRGAPKPEPLGTAGTGTTASVPAPAPAPAGSPPPPPAPIAATPSVPPAPPAPPATPTASVAPKPITNAAELVAAVMDKRFTTDQVNAACQAVGVENVASLLAKQDKLPAVLKELGV